MNQYEFFVSMNGTNEGDGTLTRPFLNLNQAVVHARKYDGEKKIFIREGKYFLEDTINLTFEDNHTTICAYQNEKVILSGARILSDVQWKPYGPDKRIQYAFVGTNMKPEQLFINGQVQSLARFPNYKEGVLPLGGVVAAEEIKERRKRWKHPETGYIRSLHAYGWGGNDYFIDGLDESADCGLALRWVGDNNRGSGYMDKAMVVENIFEELDSPGEWFYDKKTGMLYVIPDEDVDIYDPDSEIELAVTEELIHIEGQEFNKPAQNITLEGISFEKTKRTLFSGRKYIPLLRGDWSVAKAGAVFLKNAEHVTIRDCSFENVGGNAIFLYGYNKGHRIENNEICHLGASGIQVIGKDSAVDHPSFWPNEYYPEHPGHLESVVNPTHTGPVSEEYPRDIVISDNHIYDIGIFEKQSAGCNLSVSSRIKILHNTIHRSARSDINVNDGTFGGHEIAYNDIYEAQRETTDHGPFNSWGRDRFWSVPVYHGGGANGEIMRKYSKDGQTYYDITLLDACQTTKIHHNRFHHASDAPHTWGIDLDDGSSNYEIYKNLCLGMGIKLREGFERKVYNNIIINGKFEIHVSYHQARDEIYSNVVIEKTPWSFAGVDQERFEKAMERVDRNWYYHFSGKVKLPVWFYPNESGSRFEQHGIIGEDPGFANPGYNDYTITNEETAKKICFENFEMCSFGKRGCEEKPPVYQCVQDSETMSVQKKEWRGAVISEIDYAIMSSTGYAGLSGVYFERVPESSEAFISGFRERDILTAIGENEIDDIAALGKVEGMLVGHGAEAIIHRTNEKRNIMILF